MTVIYTHYYIKIEIRSITIAMYLIGPLDLTICGIETVTVFVDGSELICSNTVWESNDGARETQHTCIFRSYQLFYTHTFNM